MIFWLVCARCLGRTILLSMTPIRYILLLGVMTWFSFWWNTLPHNFSLVPCKEVLAVINLWHACLRRNHHLLDYCLLELLSVMDFNYCSYPQYALPEPLGLFATNLHSGRFSLELRNPSGFLIAWRLLPSLCLGLIFNRQRGVCIIVSPPLFLPKIGITLVP